MLLLSAQCGIRASGGRGISDPQSETERAKQYFNHWFQKTVFTHRELGRYPLRKKSRKHGNEKIVEESGLLNWGNI